jgi:hypothetical protein
MWALFSPYLMSFGLGAYAAMIFCGGPPIFDFVVSVLQFVVEWNWTLIAPLLWITTAFVSSFHKPFLDRFFPTPPNPPDEPQSRGQRRRHEQHTRRENRRCRRTRPGSIRDHGLNRNYPINLRSMGHYIRSNAPTAKERELQLSVQRLTDNVTTLRNNKVRTLKNAQKSLVERERARR